MACAQPFVCPSQAIAAASVEMEVDEILSKTCRDRVFYGNRGGLTLSGREPTAQPEALYELLRKAADSNLSVCVETCGAFLPKTAEWLAEYCDLILFDLKDTDPVRHKQNTGYSLERILSSLQRLDDLGVKTLLRCVLIPGINMDEKHAQSIAEVYAGLKNCQRVELLPYHRFGLSKGKYLLNSRKQKEFQPPDMEQLSDFFNQLIHFGCNPYCAKIDP